VVNGFVFSVDQGIICCRFSALNKKENSRGYMVED